MGTDKLNGVEMGALGLLFIGGLNWLLVGLFEFNLVTAIFGEGSALSRIIFVIVGMAAVYLMAFGLKLRRVREASSGALKTSRNG